MQLVQGKLSRLIYGITFLLGFSFPVSTALQNSGIVTLIILSLIDKDSRSQLVIAFKTPFVRSVLVMYGLFIVGVIWSSGSSHDIWHMLVKMDIYLFAPLFMGLFCNVQYKKSLFWGFACGTMLGVILSLISTLMPYHFFIPQNGIFFTYHGHVLHTFRGHTYQNYFAGILSVTLFALMLTRSVRPVWRLIYSLCIVLCVIDVFFAMTGRTGQILFVLMFVLLFVQWRVKLGLLISAFLLLVVVPLFIYSSPKLQHGIEAYVSDMSNYQAGKLSTSVGARVEFHRVSQILIMESPIFGHGTGSFNNEFLKLKSTTVTTNPHNDYLWFGVELGLMGIISLVGVILATLYQSYRLAPPWQYLGVILVTTYAVACFENSFFTDNITGQAFVIFACCLFAGNGFKKSIHGKNKQL